MTELTVDWRELTKEYKTKMKKGRTTNRTEYPRAICHVFGLPEDKERSRELTVTGKSTKINVSQKDHRSSKLKENRKNTD